MSAPVPYIEHGDSLGFEGGGDEAEELQASAAALQEVFGNAGDPTASNLMQTADRDIAISIIMSMQWVYYYGIPWFILLVV